MLKLLQKIIGTRSPANKYDITLKNYPVGSNESERIIEIPWAISHYKGQKRVLEVGPCDAIPEYTTKLRSLNIPELHGVDITEKEVPGFTMKYSDIRSTDYESNYFDLIFCISTIEHVGKDNTYFNSTKELERETNGDIKALRELERILKKGGSILLTVPYGKYHDYGWFTHYDDDLLSKLVAATSLTVTEAQYFEYKANGWYEVPKQELVNALYQQNGAPNATGLACLQLTK